MSDLWPMKAREVWSTYGGEYDLIEGFDPDELLVPADLARELYEALRPREARPDDEERMNAALVRYEREVGNGR